ncbi:MAG: hypothetical protein MN733_28530 [Nitrososphaera sp.]|nr:hypothetical protein [Nitrososphaera sp.]
MEALTITAEADYTTNALDMLTTLAAVRAQQGLNTAALEMALHILRHLASTQEAKDRAEKLRAAIEAQLSPQQFETVTAKGTYNNPSPTLAEERASSDAKRVRSEPFRI